MLDQYAVQRLVRAGVKAREVARQLGISLRSVRWIARESLDSDTPNGNTTGSTHPVGQRRYATRRAFRSLPFEVLLLDPCCRRIERAHRSAGAGLARQFPARGAGRAAPGGF